MAMKKIVAGLTIPIIILIYGHGGNKEKFYLDLWTVIFWVLAYILFGNPEI